VVLEQKSAWLSKWQLWATLENCKNLYSAGSHKFTIELVFITFWDLYKQNNFDTIEFSTFSAQDDTTL